MQVLALNQIYGNRVNQFLYISKIKISLLCLVGLLINSVLYAQSYKNDAIIGLWEVAKRNAHVCIYKQSEKEFRGKLVWIRDSLDKQGKLVLDDKNPNENKRKQQVKGLEIMFGFTYHKPNKWVDGYIYDPESGNTYSAQLTIIDTNILDIKGYISIPLLGRSERWRRIK